MDRAEIEDIFQSLGPVTIRRMFGGKGIYCDGRILALEVGGEIVLKADGQRAPAFEAAGARQWTYTRKGGRSAAMPYWSIPDDAWDDPDVMARWVRLAFEAASRAA
ncbi:TfoX/Sxy family protein [Rhizobiaceae bacterium BDR2-2]|uniref:TfoX/Sxy family protein n=1 Tax=Ectorhizobium quercum TaxID=2965071 RepID=A0AAE3SV55_9HYPH|nr:TfoX/Sxy family protein [Ectorhizobium quercum]MCX8997807.1 TfoX/Sxy family protein [Ectorhizobium quercum]